ncbi:helix-turn-helix domain-containing protein [Kitasatospora xanthocidica]|uniref:Helix-turn-helix domain-containing protein n=1 Tax=Kitasatospora xanthocidica TaxID=83382 RepID=A0A372ZSP8_9ACTN|nr:helix-turn-helix domain-containing protein [Kitasatospora xanthocidica]RGD58946.1 helix-turn-helix domain-containing protein [Kitasatospora xanthocidica]
MLTESVYRTEDVEPRDRFEYWQQQLVRLIAPFDVRTEHRADFRSEVHILPLGDVALWTMEHPPLAARRSPRLIRSSTDPELYLFSLPFGDSATAVRSDGLGAYRPHDVVLQDSARPLLLQASTDDPRQRVRGGWLTVPRQALPLSPDRIGALTARRMPGGTGVGALLVQLLAGIAADPGAYRAGDAPRLGTVALDLVSALLAHHLDAEDAVPPESRRRALVQRIRAFIRSHLHEPDLDPGAVAAAHHISVSYLHRLFEGEEETVAAWIRHQRLERARRDLADPALAATPVHVIAARCGFPRAADFSRAFRGAYGLPPRDFRHGAAATAAGGR